ncbi:hypothetical protein YC2023_064424 [Brassica napus]
MLNRVINRVLTRTSSSRVNPRKNRYWFLIIFAGLVIYNLSINLASILFVVETSIFALKSLVLGSEVTGRSINR